MLILATKLLFMVIIIIINIIITIKSNAIEVYFKL